MNNGKEIPMLGLGTYLAKKGAEARQAVEWAMEAGYRHIDTASIYENEEDVGAAVNGCGIDRDELFITTKVWNSDQGYDKTLKAFDKSLRKLDMDYVDLYLVHWPVEDVRIDTWKAVERIFQSGRARSVGVSNFMIVHLVELLSLTAVDPAVNQVEFSPFLNRQGLLKFCTERKILVEAYSPLVRGKKADNPVLQAVALNHGKTWAQVLIRWALQHGMVVLPKSVNKDRIFENADVFDFEISDEEMEKLDSLDEDYCVSWDPTKVR